MSNVIRWGILGGAKIARNRVMPALEQSKNGVITAISSRTPSSVQDLVEKYTIPNVFDSYEALLKSDTIDAVYIPLPNHLHVPYSIMAARYGKHVLCEKPISLNAEELEQLIQVQNETGVVIQEAFMVTSNQAWTKAKELIDQGEIGDLLCVTGNFSYMNRDPNNVRNVPEYGGGGLMDIGCYLTLASTFFFDKQPLNAHSFTVLDPVFKVDKRVSAILDFGTGHAMITCSMQSAPQQLLILEGSQGRIQFKIPFSQPDSEPAELILESGEDFFHMKKSVVTIPAFNQFLNHVEDFSDVINKKKIQKHTLQHSLINMRILDSLKWENLLDN